MEKNCTAKYDGYNSQSLGDNYDHITDKIKDKVGECGGIIDVNAEKNGGQGLNGVRAVFNSKESRDKFNREIDKIKKDNKKKKNINEARIDKIVNSQIKSFLKEEITKSDEKEIRDIVADCLSEFFKTIWQRKSTWVTSVKK